MSGWAQRDAERQEDEELEAEEEAAAIARGDYRVIRLYPNHFVISPKKLDMLVNVLASYRCQYTKDSIDGSGISLVDVLSPGPTIKEGKEELALLADHIAGYLIDPDD